MTPKHAASLCVLLALVITLTSIVALSACGNASGSSGASTSSSDSSGTAKVTFVELGSNSCVPCKEMKPVMRAIEQLFGDQVEVVFHDVWEDQAPAREYGINMIPTQVFLDENGEESHRHVGFYPQEEIVALLVERGLTRLTTRQ